jgi:mRNA interferase RelE/StbE
MSFRIEIDDLALLDLSRIKDRRIQTMISKRIDRLAERPIEQGKLLGDNLSGFYSVRAAERPRPEGARFGAKTQRYRIIYAVINVATEETSDDEQEKTEGNVQVLVIGIRREGDKHDAYNIAADRLT